MARKVHSLLAVFAWCLVMFMATAPGVFAQGAGEEVFVIPIHGPVEPGLARFVARGLAEAESAGAALVIFDINTLGGRVDAAFDLRDLIMASPVPTAAFVSQRALSAGALIALAGESLYMAPGATMGAAEPRPLDAKILSTVRSEFEATATARGRDPQVAAAMVDSSVAIEGLSRPGEILTLTAEAAQAAGFIDGIAAHRRDVLAAEGLSGAGFTTVGPNTAEHLARWVTHPIVAVLLFTFGLIGLITEVVTPGFGLPGALGLTFLALFFGGHLLAGIGGWTAAALLILGLVLLLVEVFVPGFGAFGFGGLLAIAAAVLFMAPTPAQGVRILIIGLAGTVVAAVILFRTGRGRAVWRRLTLAEALTEEKGFSAQAYSADLVGRRGEALTVLRPAGIALIDGQRYDVVTDGAMVPKGTPVVVVEVSGNRIVVSPVEGT
ncbi:MAG TPA: NfeD family protein [Sphingobacteriaceae bacterium]|nr:NfeD family protein [Sphingobacteriaceae bacterium]